MSLIDEALLYNGTSTPQALKVVGAQTFTTSSTIVNAVTTSTSFQTSSVVSTSVTSDLSIFAKYIPGSSSSTLDFIVECAGASDASDWYPILGEQLNNVTGGFVKTVWTAADSVGQYRFTPTAAGTFKFSFRIHTTDHFIRVRFRENTVAGGTLTLYSKTHPSM